MALYHGQEELVIAMKHKTEGMRMITERFDDPAQTLFSGSIAAVASITRDEVGWLGVEKVFLPSLSPDHRSLLFKGVLYSHNYHQIAQMTANDSSPRLIDYLCTIIHKYFHLVSLIYNQTANSAAFHNNKDKFFRACKYALLDTSPDWGRAIEMLARIILRGECSTVERHRRAWYVAIAMIEAQDFGA
ncbi:hypothetical protein BOTCAL_0137g00180 [Botryotinia calthae]|uniref:Uncharacterized protein n=1 Tax=Botryotinia calthae TaxID=38488 RepID=A0A4Y8D397_9HELO|nr:hypothetical protein BOTCAL_0137g00180 [Botryotinia calthae]